MNQQQFDAWGLFQVQRIGNAMKLSAIMGAFNDIQRHAEMERTRIEIEHSKRMAEHARFMAEHYEKLFKSTK